MIPFELNLNMSYQNLDVCNIEFEHFLHLLTEIFNRHAPVQQIC